MVVAGDGTVNEEERRQIVLPIGTLHGSHISFRGKNLLEMRYKQVESVTRHVCVHPSARA